jgi:hypothetical protein
MVAKVTSQGKSFFVENGWDIHNSPGYDSLPLQDKKFLACESIKGVSGGFALTCDFRKTIVVTKNSVRQPIPVFGADWEMKNPITLILPAGTRIEPVTHQQMEDEMNARQKPSLKEK